MSRYSSSSNMVNAMQNTPTCACHHVPQVFDYRNDVILAETCREDVNKYCKKVKKGSCFYKEMPYHCLRRVPNIVTPTTVAATDTCPRAPP